MDALGLEAVVDLGVETLVGLTDTIDIGRLHRNFVDACGHGSELVVMLGSGDGPVHPSRQAAPSSASRFRIKFPLLQLE